MTERTEEAQRPEPLADLIRRRLVEVHGSLNRAALALGVDRAQLGRWARGENVPKGKNAARFSAAPYFIPPEEFSAARQHEVQARTRARMDDFQRRLEQMEKHVELLLRAAEDGEDE